MSLCLRVFVHDGHIVCLGGRDPMFARSISGMLEEQRTAGSARPEGIVLCAEWD